MANWMSRWFGGKKAPAPVEPASPNTTLVRAADAAVGAGCRRPLVNTEGRVAGFEFRIADPLLARARRDLDHAAESAQAIAVLQSMQCEIAARRNALFALPLHIAARPAVLDNVPAGAMIALGELAGGSAGAAGAQSVPALWRAGGARVGTLGTPTPWAQFIVVDAHEKPLASLLSTVKALRSLAPGTQIVARGLADIDALEGALRGGIDFATGALDRGAQAAPRERTLTTGQQRLCQLLNRLARDDELAPLAADLRLDMDLSYRLLRWANSPLMALSRPAESVEQAVMLIGREGLNRWLTLLLLASGPGRATSRALHEVALARARLMELMAPRMLAPASAMFTMGLLSLLEVALNVPLAQALGPLQLPAPANQALIEHAGPWYPALLVSQSIENDAADLPADAVQALGGLETVLAHAATAWQWAAQAAAQFRNA